MPKLDIYISADCWSCAESRDLATAVSRQAPNVTVELRDINACSRPTNVFATPTYVLDGQIIFLGNPSLAELLAALTAG
jgi:hypothetical protein